MSTGQHTPSDSKQLSSFGFSALVLGASLGGTSLAWQAADAFVYGSGDVMLFGLAAFLLIALPVFTLEIFIGRAYCNSLPSALRAHSGRFGEFVGWLALTNSAFVLALLTANAATAFSLLPEIFGDIWHGTQNTPAFEPSAKFMLNPDGTFYNTLSGSAPLEWAIACWILLAVAPALKNIIIEQLLRVLVPIFLAIITIFGVFIFIQPDGTTALLELFRPEFKTLTHSDFWSTVSSSALFSLMLGMGIVSGLTAQTRKSADIKPVFLLVPGARLAAGLIFLGVLAALVIPASGSFLPWHSQSSLLSVLRGISKMPGGQTAAALIYLTFFAVVSITAAVIIAGNIHAALNEKFPNARAISGTTLFIMGIFSCFLLLNPSVIDADLQHHGTLGLLLQDLSGYWTVQTGIPLTVLLLCLAAGFPVGGNLKLPPFLRVQIKLVVPALLTVFLLWTLIDGISGGIYGSKLALKDFSNLPTIVALAWIGISLSASLFLTIKRPAVESEPPQ